MSKREARSITRQRLKPNFFDSSYLMLNNNVRIFFHFQTIVREEGRKRILDVGCGLKPWERLFRMEAVEYVGMDIPEGESVADVKGSAECLPFPEDSFDGLVYSEILEHSADLEKTVEEMRRVARPGAPVFVSTPFVFPEHGAPLDFLRPTRYFYYQVFRNDEIVEMAESNSSFSTPFITFNLVFDSTPLRRLWGVKHLIFLINNLIALILDSAVRFLVERITLFRKYRGRFYSFPLGYALIVRINK